jgi:hypothetical protein
MFKEFFHDEKQRLSMSKLTLFMSFFPATIVLLYYHTEYMFSWYISVYALGYAAGKGLNVLGDTKNARTSRK